MDKNTKRLRSDLESQRTVYATSVYQLKDWINLKSATFWIFLVLIPANFWVGFLTLREVINLTPVSRGIPAVSYAFFMCWAMLLTAQQSLKAQSRKRASLRLKRDQYLAAGSFDDIRAELLGKLFKTNRKQFIATALKLKEAHDLQKSIRGQNDGFWSGILNSIYDPASKPRILALFAILVAIFIATSRESIDLTSLIEVVASNLAKAMTAIFFISLLIWFFIVFIKGVYVTLANLAAAMDKKGTSSAHIHDTIKDLIDLSKI